MADVKISGLPASTTPLAGTEVLPIVQSGVTKKVAVSDLTAGRAVTASSVAATTSLTSGASGGSDGSVILKRASDGVTVQTIAVNSAVSAIDYTTAYPFHRFFNYTGQVLGVGTGVTNTDVTVSSGNLVIGTAGKGIDFSATAGTGTSELFDDYEEGTWTPTYVDSDGALVYDASGLTSGFYTKIGNTVVCQFHIQTFSITTNGTGLLSLGGLPFTSRTLAQSFYSAGSLTTGRATDFSSLNNPASGVVGSAATTVLLYKFSSDDPRTGTGTRVSAVMSTSGYDNEFWGTVIYEAA